MAEIGRRLDRIGWCWFSAHVPEEAHFRR